MRFSRLLRRWRRPTVAPDFGPVARERDGELIIDRGDGVLEHLPGGNGRYHPTPQPQPPPRGRLFEPRGNRPDGTEGPR